MSTVVSHAGRSPRDQGTEPVTPDDPTAAGGTPRWMAVGAWIRHHPLLVVLVAGVVHAVASGAWIWTSRRLGAFDPDEAGYLATALRYQRAIDFSHPGALLDELAATTNGPLVPFLSLPFLLAGPRDPRAAMLVQPVLAVVTALAAAGIARRLAGPTAAVVVGLFVLGLPTVLLAATSYWFGLGAAACLAGALWALVASEQLTNRWRWVFGACCGLMLLARTMSLGFLPGLLAGGLVVAWGDRRRLRGWAEAVAVTAVVAAPWWIAQRDEILDYLVGYGYGSRAALWGSGNLLERLADRLVLVSWSSFFLPVIPLALGALLWSGRGVVSRSSWRGPWSERRRATVALAVVVVTGFAALVSTTNRGVWFELPLVIALLPLGAAVVCSGPPLPRRFLAGWMLLVAVIAPVALRALDIGHADGALVRYDERLADRGAEEREAAREWRALNEAVAADLAELTDRGRAASAWVTGNMFLFNTNSLELTAELDGWAPKLGVPDTLARGDARALQLTSRVDGVERILVVARHDFELFTPDLEWRSFEREALASGWEPVRLHRMPVDGEVVVLRHRDALGGE